MVSVDPTFKSIVKESVTIVQRELDLKLMDPRK